MLKLNNNNLKILVLSSLILFGIFIYHNAQAATTYFSPSSGNFTTGNIFTVNILVNTEGVAVNNAEAVINFPSNLLEMVSLSKSGSIFSLWVEEPTFSNSVGTLSFNGGAPTPGFNGSAGKILSAVFRVKKEGSASLIFSSVAVRANDGYGTDVFKSGAQSFLNLISEEKPLPQKEEPSSPPVAGKAPAAPQISSPTHSDPERWYNNSNPKLSWTVPSDATAARIMYDKFPNSTPGVVYSPAISEKQLENIKDGIYYFHVQLKNAEGWGEISHFRFQIDTHPPEPFVIKFIDGNKTENPRPAVVFDTTDFLSGIEYYKIKIGEGDFFSVAPEIVKSNPYALPLQNLGKRNILVQAFDKAGNYVVATEEFVIKSIETPTIAEYPKELASGEILIIKGATYPDAHVVIWFQREKDEPKSFTVQSDQDGKFTFTADERLRDGIYQLWAEVVDTRGVRSLPSEKITIAVAKSAIFRIGNWAVSLLAVIVPLIALIFILFFIVWYGWYRFVLFRKKISKETKETKEALHQAFKALKEETEEQVVKLDGKPGLSERERKICNDLKKALKISEEFIGKEIEDIEKKIKK